MKKTLIIIVSALVLVGLAGGGYYLYTNYKSAEDQKVLDEAAEAEISETEGKAFDWRVAEFYNDGNEVDSMPTDEWDYIESTIDRGDGEEVVGLWLYKSTPSFGDRELKKGDTGEDVKVLQAVLNKLATKDTSDTNYYAQLELTGTFDDKTLEALNKYERSMKVDVTQTVSNAVVSYLIYSLNDDLGEE